mmetsp:Transcript_37642/g.107531  ORF Transcript_37642/g.107531 Transcript_37642/m.107531 type:complete len:274 (+) Transcript_37642:470-1291(+)
MSQSTLQDPNQRVERCQVEVNVGIPHVVLELHRHERHHTAEEEDSLHLGLHNLGGGIPHLLWEGPLSLCRIEGLAREDAKLHHLERYEAGLLQVPGRVLEHIAEHGHAALVTGDKLEVLKNHHMHQGGDGVGVVGGRWIAGLCDSSYKRALVLELMRVPVEAELEVDAVAGLAPHLRLHGLPGDVPLEAPELLRLNDARVGRQVELVAREALPDLVRVPECLAEDLLLLEAAVEVARNQPEGGLSVLLQIDQEVPELTGVDEGLRLVGPLAFR